MESTMSKGTWCLARRMLMERAQRMGVGGPKELRLLLPLAIGEAEILLLVASPEDMAVLLSTARERRPPGTKVHTVKSELMRPSPNNNRLVVFSAKFT